MGVLVDEVGGGLIPGGQPGVRQDLWLENTGIKSYTVERLDQGHLHPLLEHPRQTCRGRGAKLRPPAPQVSTLAKS